MWSRRSLVAGLAFAPFGRAAAQFRIEISGIGATQWPIALPAWRGESAAPSAPSAIVRADLERSGAFRVVEAAGVWDETSALPVEQLKRAGADAWLSASLVRLADRSWDVRYRLWDVVKGQPFFARAASVAPSDLRLAAHRVADEIYQQFTGDRGVFSTRIAYVTRAGRQYALYVADADGEARQVALSSNEPIISPAWSPNGKSLAYVSFEQQKAAIWLQDVATGQRRQVANFKGSNSAPAFSPDGTELAVTLSRDAVAQLYLLGLDGAAPRRLTTSASIDTEPTFSPDGKTIFFVSDRGGGPQVYRVSREGGRVERVTFRGSYNISPSISPDGNTLAYISREGGAFRLAVQDLGTGAVQTLSEGPDDESPSFAPNGRLILYASRAQGRDVLMTTTLDGKIKARLLTTGQDMREPAWGPFGR